MLDHVTIPAIILLLWKDMAFHRAKFSATTKFRAEVNDVRIMYAGLLFWLVVWFQNNTRMQKWILRIDNLLFIGLILFLKSRQCIGN